MGKERQLSKLAVLALLVSASGPVLALERTLEGPRGEVGVAAGSKQLEIFCCDFAQSLTEFLSHPRLPLFLRL